MDREFIVKSGSVFLQTKGLLKTSWVEKFCVLHKKTEDQHPYLEFFVDKNAFTKVKERKEKSEVKRIELNHVRSIKQSSQKSSKHTEHQLEIKCRHQKVVLMFNGEGSDALAQEWYMKLNNTVDIAGGEDGSSTGVMDHVSLDRDSNDDDDDDDGDEVVTLNSMYGSAGNDVQRFAVEVESSPLAKLCNIEGSMTLMVTNSEIAFEHQTTHAIVCRFSFIWLRRFGKTPNIVYFECGRKCQYGEGIVRCHSDSAAVIHKLLTGNSKSKGKTVYPSKPNDFTENQSKVQIAITNPSLALNASRKHPGQKINQTLIPITPPVEESSPTMPAKHFAQSSIKENGNTIHDSKTASPIAEVTKQLEEKLSQENGALGGSKKADDQKPKTKEEKKREKEEKKEREKREKEEKKEREKREKEEKKERERREKESKKKSKKIDDSGPSTPPVTALKPSFRAKNNIYDEPENLNLSNNNDEVLYDEAVPQTGSIKSGSIKSGTEPVEYAQPFGNKNGSNADKGDSDMMTYVYATAEDNKANAWKKFGRKEEEECFEEDYSNIKSARHESLNAPLNAPPIPSRSYDELEDEFDDTYNRLDLVHVNRSKPQHTENLYGEASAKKVEPRTLPVRKGDDSESEGEELEEESPYDAPEIEAYEDPQELMNNVSLPGTSNKTGASLDYEEAVINQNVVPKETRREPLYEEVP